MLESGHTIAVVRRFSAQWTGWRERPAHDGPQIPELPSGLPRVMQGRSGLSAARQFIVEGILAAKQQPARYIVHNLDDLPNNGTTVAAGRIYAEARDVARALAKTEAFKQSSRDRKRVEMLFAHLKVAFRGRQDRC